MSGCDELCVPGAGEKLACNWASATLLETSSARAGIGDEATSGDGVLLGIASVSCC